MTAAFFGFIAFAIMCFHVFGAYQVALQTQSSKQYVEAGVGFSQAIWNVMMALFWLLVTSRLLGW